LIKTWNRIQVSQLRQSVTLWLAIYSFYNCLIVSSGFASGVASKLIALQKLTSGEEVHVQWRHCSSVASATWTNSPRVDQSATWFVRQLTSPRNDLSATWPVRDLTSPRVGNPRVGLSANWPVTAENSGNLSATPTWGSAPLTPTGGYMPPLLACILCSPCVNPSPQTKKKQTLFMARSKNGCWTLAVAACRAALHTEPLTVRLLTSQRWMESCFWQQPNHGRYHREFYCVLYYIQNYRSVLSLSDGCCWCCVVSWNRMTTPQWGYAEHNG